MNLRIQIIIINMNSEAGFFFGSRERAGLVQVCVLIRVQDAWAGTGSMFPQEQGQMHARGKSSPSILRVVNWTAYKVFALYGHPLGFSLTPLALILFELFTIYYIYSNEQ